MFKMDATHHQLPPIPILLDLATQGLRREFAPKHILLDILHACNALSELFLLGEYVQPFLNLARLLFPCIVNLVLLTCPDIQ